MATKVRIEFHSDKADGFPAILNDPGVAADIEARAKRICDAAGDGVEYEMTTFNYGGSPRVGAIIKTATYEARLNEARHKTLSTAFEAGR